MVRHVGSMLVPPVTALQRGAAAAQRLQHQPARIEQSRICMQLTDDQDCLCQQCCTSRLICAECRLIMLHSSMHAAQAAKQAQHASFCCTRHCAIVHTCNNPLQRLGGNRIRQPTPEPRHREPGGVEFEPIQDISLRNRQGGILSGVADHAACAEEARAHQP